MVDVSEEGVGAPAAKDLYGLGVIAIEMKGCCSSSSEGVAGDGGRGNALAFQVKGAGSFAEDRCDLAGIDSETSRVLGAEVGAYDGVRGVVGTGSDVGDSADEGFDWTDGRVGCFMVYDSPSLAILLIVNGEGGSCALL